MQIPDYISASYIKNCYKNTSLSKSKSSKKLASGYRINTAADDAAKLSISEKMRAQIRGLDQASNNIQDSISFLQVADGALETASTIMQRIRELAVQAANDTYTDQDRDQMQQECNQLQAEMLSMFEQTAFHSKPIFTDLDRLSTTEVSEHLLKNQIPLFDSELILNEKTIPASVNTLNMVSRIVRLNEILQDIKKKAGDGELDHSEIMLISNYILEFVQYAKDMGEFSRLTEYQETLSAAEKDIKDAIQDEKDGKDAWKKMSAAYSKLRELRWDVYFIGTYLDASCKGLIDIINPSNTPANIIDDIENIRLPKFYEALTRRGLRDTVLRQSLEEGKYEDAFKMLAKLSGIREISLSLQNGSNANQGMKLQVVIPTIPQKSFDLSSHINANTSINRADRFLTQLTAARSEIGAYQNRLESALSYTGQGAEALQDTESRMQL